MHTYGIALGSNLGDRRATMAAARRRMAERLGGEVVAVSPLYQTEPVGCPTGSPHFLNAVIELRAAAPPLDVLAAARETEKDWGRERGQESPNAPRPLDLDLLYAIGPGGEPAVHSSAELVLPHPRLHLRRFVLEPLANIRPRLVLPGFDRDVAALRRDLNSDEPPPTLVSRSW